MNIKLIEYIIEKIADSLMIVISEIIDVVDIVIMSMSMSIIIVIQPFLFAYSCINWFSLHIPGIHLLKVWVNHTVNFITNLQKKPRKHYFKPNMV